MMIRILTIIGLERTTASLSMVTMMFVGMMIMYYVDVFKRRGKECGITYENWLAGLVMYFSYFLLFVVFAVQRYCLPKSAKEDKKKRDDDKKKTAEEEKKERRLKDYQLQRAIDLALGLSIMSEKS